MIDLIAMLYADVIVDGKNDTKNFDEWKENAENEKDEEGGEEYKKNWNGNNFMRQGSL